MILTVTLNPLLEKVYRCKEVSLSSVMRAEQTFYRAGGKGINVSRQLNKLGVKNSALTFLGGTNGKILRKILMDEGINFSAVSQKSETRSGSVLVSENSKTVTTVMENSQDITEKEAGDFLEKLDKAIQNCSTVVFMGSSPSTTTDKIYAEGVKLAQKYDKFCFTDTYGKQLFDVFNSTPDAIHNNVTEIENSLRINLSTEDKIISFLNGLYIDGIKIALLTNGKKPSYVMHFGFIYKASFPTIKEVDPQGSGDSFTAGFLYAFDRSLIFQDCVKIASAAGIANAEMFEISNVSIEQINNYKENVTVTPMGKKLKVIDDAPTC